MGETRARVVIVGAGHAGGALALELRRLGHTGPITLVGAEQHLPYERPSLSKELLTGAEDGPTFVAEAAVWADKGIELRLRATAERIARADQEVHLAGGGALGYDHLVLATGGAARSLVPTMAAELVLAGIGITPGTALASAAGLPCPDGIAVDDRYVTADPAISAVGDVACPPGGRHESWGHAQSSARAAALAILGLPAETAAVNWFWTVQHGHTLQIAGDPMRGMLAARRRVAVSRRRDRRRGRSP